VMPTKNSLTATDAERVEQAFQVQLTTIVTDQTIKEAKPPVRHPARGRQRRTSAIDKSMLVLPAPRRIRDRRTCQINCEPTVSSLRPASRGCTPFEICAITGTWTQGQR